MELFHYEVDGDGIATLTWDDPLKPVNVFNEASLASLAAAVRRANEDAAARAVILASAKRDFVAGGDLAALMQFGDEAKITTWFELLHRVTREIERCRKPWVAALNGSALGGGLEIALACHGRIAVADDAIRIGLPEVTLGLFPAGGGTQRLPRLVGIAAGLRLILEGARLPPAEAQRLGIVDAMVPRDALMKVARDWVKAVGEPRQPWDKSGFVPPGGSVGAPENSKAIADSATEMPRRSAANGPAAAMALACVRDGVQVSIDDGLALERRLITELLLRPATGAMIRTMFFSLSRAKKSGTYPPPPDFVEAVRGAYVEEGLRLLAEGVAGSRIEAGARLAGMAKGPLEIAASLGRVLPSPEGNAEIDDLEIGERLLLIQTLAALRCLADGGIVDADAADVSSILDCGFPRGEGGILSRIAVRGLASLRDGAARLAAHHGARFDPSPFDRWTQHL